MRSDPEHLRALAHLMQPLIQLAGRGDEALALVGQARDGVLLVENAYGEDLALGAHVPVSIARRRVIIASTRDRASSDFSTSVARSAIRLLC